ncbi:MAG: PTS sugar transporter subunit IIA, partial [Planctomycetes bacterium]|nr:PTS sugar transporter subunit IIA [Planctomycetota bacterium]
VIIDGQHKFDILLVRAIDGIKFSGSDDLVHTIFALVGSKDERNYHLRALMAIAQVVQDTKFESRWLAARDAETLRNLILLSKRKRDTN